tara:strand:- start:110 stop:373 length:264 start_codon:yes stop_codon:yes gene_type:complete
MARETVSNKPKRKDRPKARTPRVVKDAMDTTKLLKEEGVQNVMEKLGGKKQPDGSYVFNDKETVKKSIGGLINGRPTGKGKGAARSV